MKPGEINKYIGYNQNSRIKYTDVKQHLKCEYKYRLTAIIKQNYLNQ